MSRSRSRSPLVRRGVKRSYSPWDEQGWTHEESPRLQYLRRDRSRSNWDHQHRRMSPAHNHTSDVSPGAKLVRKLMQLLPMFNGHAILDQHKWQRLRRLTLKSLKINIDDDIPTFFSQFQDHFYIQEFGEGTYDVTPKINLGLCKDHCSSKGKCEQRTCESLHCCKFHLQGTCKWGDKCRFGHDLDTRHNHRLLERQLLDELNPKQLGAILKLSNMAATIFPKICKYYNFKASCSKGKLCKSLHVCKYYAMGSCRFGRSCHKSHDVFNSQTRAILVKHGVNVGRRQEEVLEELRLVYNKDEGIESGEEAPSDSRSPSYCGSPSDSGSSSDSGSDEEYISINNHESVRGRNKERCKESGSESNTSSEDESEEGEIGEGEIGEGEIEEGEIEEGEILD